MGKSTISPTEETFNEVALSQNGRPKENETADKKVILNLLKDS